MSDPVRKPTSSPPDVDSLMSRLDAGERPSDPGERPVDSARPPSAAELLGGRGRRRRGGIRVPDDAVPVSAPKASRRSVPPAAPAPSQPRTSGVVDAIALEPPQGPIITPLGVPALVAVTLPAASNVEEPSVPPASTPPSSALLERSSFVADPPADVLAAMTAPVAPIVVMQQRIISIGGPATALPRSRPPIAPPPESFAVLGPDDLSSGTHRVAVAEPTPLMPGALPIPPVPSDLVPPRSASEPAPADASVGPDGPVTAEPVTPAALPDAKRAERPRAPTVPNLDATVREALAMLDTSDFDTSVDVPVMIDEPVPGPGEDTLDDQVVVEVKARKAPPPPKRGFSEPAPATPQPGATLPSQPSPVEVPIVVIEPPRIVAAAAASVAAPVAAAPIASAVAPPATAPVAPPSAGAAPSAGPAASPPPAAPVAPPEASEQKRKKRQWFEELFNDDFARATPRAGPAFLAREARFIEDSLGCEKGATILDLGCGAGEQAVAIASHGYEVIGVDLSLAMLARAADEAAEKQQRINFLQGDMRELSFESAFDGVYCWGMTFGYFDDAKNAEVISKIHRALRPGGRFLLDVNNRDFLACRLPSMIWFEGEGCVCMDEVQMNSITSRLQVKRTMMMEDGRQRELEYSIRLYALHELGKLLHDHGFRVAEASGDTATPGVFFGADSPRIMILAEKR